MSASLKLPPSGRDFQVYQRIVVDGASTRTVAAELEISQTRVRQIVIRVAQWLVETLPENSDLSEAAQFRLGRHIAADRLERFYVEANRLWTQTSQIKFAGLCIRVIAAQSKVPAMPGTLEALAADAILGPLPDNVGQTVLVTRVRPGNAPPRGSSLADTATRQEPRDLGFPGGSLGTSIRKMKEATADKNVCPTSNSPVRECSPAPSKANGASENNPTAPVTTSSATASSDKLHPATRAARSAFLAPAHMPEKAGDEPPVTEIKITPQTLGLTVKKNLSRKERRRLRRIELAKS